MKFIKLVIGCLTVVMLFSAFGVLFAAGLSTNFSDVYIDNLRIGASYNLSQAANLPMWVNLKGGGLSDVVLETTIPSTDDIKKGYEPLPDASWVTFSKKKLLMLPGESSYSDVIVTIPNDPKYLGKKYMAHIFITGTPAKGEEGGIAIALGIKGKLYIGIASAPMTEAESKEFKKKRANSSQGVIVVPEKLFGDYPASEIRTKITDIEQLKIINPSKEELTVSLEAVDPEITGVSVPTNFAKGEMKDLSFSKNKIVIKPDSLANFDVFVTKPKEQKNPKLFYVIKISVKSPTIEIAKYVTVYIEK